ncbi:hypothetical protein [Halococcus agarilyticus]|uniref:hypothetical protein n=1 Tax=Halococcus agarilyticus TaxID=1232219 RepID=UPI0006778D42|nr:hypothetical protein [Halococcus agarilyticus]
MATLDDGRENGPFRRSIQGTIWVASLPIPGWLFPLHGWSTTTPVPHWVVLLVTVPCLWLAIGGGVVAVERVLGALFDSS